MRKVASKRTRMRLVKKVEGFGRVALRLRNRRGAEARAQPLYWAQPARRTNLARYAIFYFPMTPRCHPDAQSRGNSLHARISLVIEESIIWKDAVVMDGRNDQTVGSALRRRLKQRASAKRSLVN